MNNLATYGSPTNGLPMNWPKSIELIGQLITEKTQLLEELGESSEAARLRHAWEVVIRGV